MKIAEGIEMLELSAKLIIGPATVYPTVIWDKDSVILVDTGLPGMVSEMRRAMTEAGLDLNQITHIIMTHHDIDHIGGLSALLKDITHKVEVICHEDEKPYVQGDLPPIKINAKSNSQMEEQLKHLTDEQRQAIMSVFTNFQVYTAPVDHTLVDGEVLPCCGGITVIHTPGHTPGHICLYHKQSKTLLTGDALYGEKGRLISAPSFTNQNSKAALESLKKLVPFETENIICYHGGFCKGHGSDRIKELATD